MPGLRWIAIFSSFLILLVGATTLSAAAAAPAANSPQPAARAARPAGLTQLAELTPSVRMNQDWFGISVAASGNTVAVGNFDPNIENSGTVDVFVKPPSGWTNMTQAATLISSDNGEGFGISVAISGNTIVVGAANTSNFSPQSGPGAAYVFVEPSGGWSGNLTESAKLTAADGQNGDAFGDSVAISGGTIGVGAFFAMDSHGNGFAGRAYVFVKPAGGWVGNLTQTAELTASDSELLNYMGASIAVTGNTLVAGAYGHNNFAGVAYVFAKPVGGWVNSTQTAELSASDAHNSADFGFSSAISGDTIVEGAVGAGGGKGTGYVFVEPAGGWVNMTQSAELRMPNAESGSGFGQSASISGRAVAIGAPETTVGANSGQGAVYTFLKPAAGWHGVDTRGMELTASDGAANDGMGVSCGISGSTVVTGAVKSGPPGSAYVFGK